MIPNPQKLIPYTQSTPTYCNPPPGTWFKVALGEPRRWSIEFLPDDATSFQVWFMPDMPFGVGYNLNPPQTLLLEFAKQLVWLTNEWWIFNKGAGGGMMVVDTIILGTPATDTQVKAAENVSC